jgi:BirA family biotin operon repressor/biotin-[acetyl-CoA-carboxylase] ligase
MDSLAPEIVEPLLSGRFGKPYRYEPSCESTQTLLGADDPEGAAAAADEQTGGRGRLGRTWQAPAGTSILVSVLLRPPPERRVAELSLLGGIAAADAVERALNLTVQIKWPNDVMLNRRKVAGVLAEARDDAVVLGIGINVNQERDQLPADTAIPPTSLLVADGKRYDRAPILADLLQRLELHYDMWRDGGLGAVYESLGPRDFLRGRRVAVNGTTGFGVGIDREGRFELEVAGEHRFIESGEVTYER